MITPDRPAPAGATRAGRTDTVSALPYFTVFLSSMGIMVVELAASRLVSKYFGTSLYTWTGVIGIVLGGIAVGNFVGGRLADRHSPAPLGSWLLLAASALVFLVLLLDLVLGAIVGSTAATVVTSAVVLRAVATIALLFFLPSAALGTVSPAMAKLALERSSGMGKTVGTVYALGSAGSILGTFLAGYMLIPLVGVRSIVFFVSVVVALLALALARRRLVVLAWLALLVIAWLLLLGPLSRREQGVLFSRYSAYSYMEVKDIEDAGGSERVLVMDGLIHNRYDSSDPDDLLYEYERFFAAITRSLAPRGRAPDTLTIGGGAFLFPQYLERHYPQGMHHVVEIDPVVVRTARRFFDLAPESRLGITVADARTFVNWAASQEPAQRPRYDFVYLDAFNSYSVPSQLTTLEFVRSMELLLAPDGLFVVNLIDIFSMGRFLGAFHRTVAAVFEEVAVYESLASAPDLRNTFVLACSHGAGLPAALTNTDADAGRPMALRIPKDRIDDLLARTGGFLLTDDYAPVEYLMAGVFLGSVQ